MADLISAKKPGFHFWKASVCMKETRIVRLDKRTASCALHIIVLGHEVQQVSQIGHGQTNALCLSEHMLVFQFLVPLLHAKTGHYQIFSFFFFKKVNVFFEKGLI